MRKPKRSRKIVIEGEQAVRLEELARRWGTTPTEALRRALDQAFVGRGAMVALQAGLIFLENMEFKKPTELKPEEKPDPQMNTAMDWAGKRDAATTEDLRAIVQNVRTRRRPRRRL